jgi:hypothetical protein
VSSAHRGCTTCRIGPAPAPTGSLSAYRALGGEGEDGGLEDEELEQVADGVWVPVRSSAPVRMLQPSSAAAAAASARAAPRILFVGRRRRRAPMSAPGCWQRLRRWCTPMYIFAWWRNSKNRRLQMAEIGILNVGAGDTKLVFDKNNPAECIRAARIVKDMLRRGYALLVDVGEGKTQRVLDFDETQCEYIIADLDPVAAEAADREEQEHGEGSTAKASKTGRRTKEKKFRGPSR